MESNEKIKKALQCRSNLWYCVLHDCTYYRDKISMCSQDVARDALDYIQHLENRIGELTEKVKNLEAMQPKWVSVEDHLPNDGQVVLAWYGGVEVDRLYFSNEAPGIFLEMNGEVKVHNVTHWMHLPELPKEHHEGGTTK